MAYSIDSQTYNKARAYPIYHGYATRPSLPTSIVVHSTEGVRGQTLESAAGYLFRSADVSADFLIGKGDQIIQFLDSRIFQAWHAGGYQSSGIWTAQPAYSNVKSIGIECLHAAGETWPAAQKATLEWLLEYLMRTYAIPILSIETHGQIALPGPYDRKRDPTNWPHADFIAWRDATLSTVPAYPQYEIIAPCTVVTSRSGTAPLAGGPDNGQTRLEVRDVVNVGDVQDGWLWVSDGPESDPGIGFILACYAKAL